MARAFWMLAAGLLVGIALGAFFFSRPSRPMEDAENEPVRHADETLRPDAAPRSGPEPADDEPRAADPGARPPLPSGTRPTGAGEIEPAAGGRLWLARATIAAAERRRDAFFAATDEADERGASSIEIVATLAVLPEPERSEWTTALRARHPAWPSEEMERAVAKLGDGSLNESVALIEALKRIEENPTFASAILEIARDGGWSGEAVAALGEKLIELDFLQSALPFFELAFERDPFDADYLRPILDAWPERAVALAAASVARHPGATGWSILADARLRIGDRAGAFAAAAEAVRLELSEDALERLLRIDPEQAIPVIREGVRDTDDDEMIGVLASAYERAGMKEAAMEELQRAHRLDRSDFEWLSRMLILDPERTRVLLADEVRDMGDDPSDGADEVIGAYARALRATGDPNAAFFQFERAHRLDPEDRDWLRGMAQASPARAIELLEPRAGEGGSDFHGALGDAYARTGRPGDAILAYERAIATADSDTAAKWMGAIAQIDEKRGFEKFAKLLESEPDNDEIWGAYGDAYRELGRPDEARKAYEKALTLDPEDWEWRLRRDQVR